MTTKNAYAKIKLTLEIRERREDGYHNIRSVMQKVSLCDTLTFEKNDEGKITLTCNVDVCAPEDNLAYKAAVLYLDAYKKEQGKAFGVKIHINKILIVCFIFYSCLFINFLSLNLLSIYLS